VVQGTSWIALAISLILVFGLIFSVWIISLKIVVLQTYLGKPKLTFLKSTLAGNGFAFAFDFNESKEPAKFNRFKIRLFNPGGSPSHLEVSAEMKGFTSSFAQDLEMGPGLVRLLGADGFDSGRILVEVVADKDGIIHQYDMSATKFKKKVLAADLTAQEYTDFSNGDFSGKSVPFLFFLKSPLAIVDILFSGENPNPMPVRSFIADAVPGSGAQLAIQTNPSFAHLFGGGGGSADAAAPAAEQFAVAKVWIEDGCIVCNACEDIYEAVFEVTSDSCIIRENAPLDDGLRMQDAAEACPVEIIKFTIAS
jgi:ferredoxin